MLITIWLDACLSGATTDATKHLTKLCVLVIAIKLIIDNNSLMSDTNYFKL